LQRRPCAALIVAASLAAAIVSPVVLVHKDTLKRYERHRPESWISLSSARLADYQKMPASNLLRRRDPDNRGYSLCPGFALPLLACIGAGYALAQCRLRSLAACLLLIIAWYTLLSFCPIAEELKYHHLLAAPYQLLRDYYPGFRFARNLWRFGALAQCLLGLLAGIGAAALTRLSPKRPAAAIAMSAVAAVLAVDLLATGVPLLEAAIRPDRLTWPQWLQQSPPQTVIVHLPVPVGTNPHDFDQTTFWMLCQMYHARPMANGYSGYVPTHTSLLNKAMTRFPDVASIDMLHRYGITHVLAAGEWMSSERAQDVAHFTSELAVVLQTPEMTIFRVTGVP
jgi:hypothetical protein